MARPPDGAARAAGARSLSSAAHAGARPPRPRSLVGAIRIAHFQLALRLVAAAARHDEQRDGDRGGDHRDQDREELEEQHQAPSASRQASRYLYPLPVLKSTTVSFFAIVPRPTSA